MENLIEEALRLADGADVHRVNNIICVCNATAGVPKLEARCQQAITMLEAFVAEKKEMLAREQARQVQKLGMAGFC